MIYYIKQTCYIPNVARIGGGRRKRSNRRSYGSKRGLIIRMRGGCDTWNTKPDQMKYELFKCISQEKFMELTHKVWYKIGNKIEAVLKQTGITQYGQVWTDKIIEKYLSKRARTVTEAIQLLVPGYASELSYEKIIEQFNELLQSGKNDDVWWKDYKEFKSEAIEVKKAKEEEAKEEEEAKNYDLPHVVKVLRYGNPDEIKITIDAYYKAEKEKKEAEEKKKEKEKEEKRAFYASPEGKEEIRQRNQAQFDKMQQIIHERWPDLTYTLTPNNYGNGNQ